MDLACLPDRTTLATWSERGIRELTVSSRLTGQGPVLEFLGFLRDAAGYRMAVGWHGSLGGYDAAVSHLQPAADGDTAWRAAHRPLGLTFHRGPGFIRVCRERGPRDQTDIVFGDPLLLRAFGAAQRPVRPADHGGERGLRAALDFLVSHGLVVTHGDRALATPVRVLRWPKHPGTSG